MRILFAAAFMLLVTQASPSIGQTTMQQAAEALNSPASTTCRVGNVGVFGNRVHVRCAGDPSSHLSQLAQQMNAQLGAGGGQAAAGAPSFFAVGVQNDPSLANLTLSLATQAAAQNRQVQIFFTPNPGANPPGCLPSDCRRLVGLIMVVQN